MLGTHSFIFHFSSFFMFLCWFVNLRLVCVGIFGLTPVWRKMTILTNSIGDCTAAEDVCWPDRPALTQRVICVEHWNNANKWRSISCQELKAKRLKVLSNMYWRWRLTHPLRIATLFYFLIYNWTDHSTCRVPALYK
jgi:hypothetical protein